jgi:hypothetical protein
MGSESSLHVYLAFIRLHFVFCVYSSSTCFHPFHCYDFSVYCRMLVYVALLSMLSSKQRFLLIPKSFNSLRHLLPLSYFGIPYILVFIAIVTHLTKSLSAFIQ